MEEDFSMHPPTLGEARADKTENAADWAPRDVLVRLLRAIDSGELKPDAIVVCYRGLVGGEEMTGWTSASPSALMSLGILARVAHNINETVR